jgi:hypothetical protein
MLLPLAHGYLSVQFTPNVLAPVECQAIGLLYALGFGLLALSELVSFLDVAGIWSAAATFGIAGTAATVIAAVIPVVALLAIGAGIVMQIADERSYRLTHGMAQ